MALSRILILGIGTAAKRRVLITFCGSPYPRDAAAVRSSKQSAAVPIPVVKRVVPSRSVCV
ncbi:hypothetical protein HYS47_01965 [Candidatus Woesearchaeota archaeon]|nr:hypothetical protein [Candidatus Woesearchaeota archaeon]